MCRSHSSAPVPRPEAGWSRSVPGRRANSCHSVPRTKDGMLKIPIAIFKAKSGKDADNHDNRKNNSGEKHQRKREAAKATILVMAGVSVGSMIFPLLRLTGPPLFFRLSAVLFCSSRSASLRLLRSSRLAISRLFAAIDTLRTQRWNERIMNHRATRRHSRDEDHGRQ